MKMECNYYLYVLDSKVDMKVNNAILEMILHVLEINIPTKRRKELVFNSQ